MSTHHTPTPSPAALRNRKAFLDYLTAVLRPVTPQSLQHLLRVAVNPLCRGTSSLNHALGLRRALSEHIWWGFKNRVHAWKLLSPDVQARAEELWQLSVPQCPELGRKRGRPVKTGPAREPAADLKARLLAMIDNVECELMTLDDLRAEIARVCDRNSGMKI